MKIHHGNLAFCANYEIILKKKTLEINRDFFKKHFRTFRNENEIYRHKLDD